MNGQVYIGHDNLEIMHEALKYNQYLLGLIILQAPEDVKILVDFGAGIGTFAKPIQAAGYRVICVEKDPLLTKTLQQSGLEVIDDLNFLENNSVDYIYILNVLEHIEDEKSLLQTWFKKLRPGGKLLVYVPAFKFLFTSMDHKVGHLRRYTRRMLSERISESGFVTKKARYADSLGIFATLLYKVLDNGDGNINRGMLKVYDRCAFPLSRILDFVLGRFFGKNVYVCAIKPIDE